MFLEVKCTSLLRAYFFLWRYRHECLITSDYDIAESIRYLCTVLSQGLLMSAREFIQVAGAQFQGSEESSAVSDCGNMVSLKMQDSGQWSEVVNHNHFSAFLTTSHSANVTSEAISLLSIFLSSCQPGKNPKTGIKIYLNETVI